MWRKRFLIGVVLAICILFVAGISFAAGARVATQPANSMASRIPLVGEAVRSLSTQAAVGAPPEVEDDFEVFWDVWNIVEEDYYGDPDPQAMIQGAIDGMVETLGDSYTQYVNPQENEIMREDDSGSFEGIGATVDMIDGQLTVVSPLKGSPAAQAGLQAGDVILKVDATTVKDMDLLEAVSLVRGPEGSTVTLTIQREGVAEPFEIPIQRAEIELVTVESRMLTNEVGYLTINSFGGRTVEELDANLQSLADQGAQALVLDLRNNPGGFLDAAVETVSRFLDAGPVVWWQNADGSSYPLRVKERQTYDWPMVVLVNEGSASASEIVAGALQDSGRATLLGTQTFGKGSVQNVHQLRDGGSLRVTTAHWLTRDKHEINGIGLKPDHYVTQETDVTGVDRQLNIAHRMLQQAFDPPLQLPFE